MQSITVLPDMVVEKKYDIRLEVQDGRVKMYTYDNADYTWVDKHDVEGWYSSLAEFFLRTLGSEQLRCRMFIEKLELQTSYDVVAEHCATEMEDAVMFGNVLQEIMGELRCLSQIKQSKKNDGSFTTLTWYMLRKVDYMIKENPALKGHISLLEENDVLQQKCGKRSSMSTTGF